MHDIVGRLSVVIDTVVSLCTAGVGRGGSRAYNQCAYNCKLRIHIGARCVFWARAKPLSQGAGHAFLQYIIKVFLTFQVSDKQNVRQVLAEVYIDF